MLEDSVTRCYICPVPSSLSALFWETSAQPSREGQSCQVAGTLWRACQAATRTQSQVRVDPRPSRREDAPPISQWAGAAWTQPGRMAPLSLREALIRDTGQSCGQTSEPTDSSRVTALHHRKASRARFNKQT